MENLQYENTGELKDIKRKGRRRADFFEPDSAHGFEWREIVPWSCRTARRARSRSLVRCELRIRAEDTSICGTTAEACQLSLRKTVTTKRPLPPPMFG